MRKVIISFMIGLIVGVTGIICAEYAYKAKDVLYSPSDKAWNVSNVQSAISDLYGQAGSSNYLTEYKLVSKIKLGDYIKMSPTSTSYELTTSQTAYSSNQTINPSQLDLWRVIKINADGTFEAISAYTQGTTSGDDLYFGVNNGVYKTTAETLANQYMNTKYTESVRFISDGNGFETKNSESLTTLSDAEIVTSSLGDLIAYDINDKTTAKNYFTSVNASYSRGGCTLSDGKDHCHWNGYGIYTINTSGSVSYQYQYSYSQVFADNVGSDSKNVGAAIRPIVKFKSAIEVASGDGKTEETAFILK